MSAADASNLHGAYVQVETQVIDRIRQSLTQKLGPHAPTRSTICSTMPRKKEVELAAPSIANAKQLRIDDAHLGVFGSAIVDSYTSRLRAIREDPNHHPETSLYSPLEDLLRAAAQGFRPGSQVVAQHRTQQCGVPDFGLLGRYGHPFAYVEAKAPDKSIELSALRGSERAQFDRYMELPCVLYTNFSDLVLYEHGEEVERALLADPRSLRQETYRKVVTTDLVAATRLLERLFRFAPAKMKRAEDVADALARHARVLRSVVTEVVADEGNNPLVDVFREFEDVLFHGLTKDEFADAYAQTLTYGLLLARIVMPDGDLTLQSAPVAIGADHKLLSSALRLLGQPEVTSRIGWSVEALIATMQLVSPTVLTRDRNGDPTVYFYEKFLAAYDPGLRKQVGAYFTPIDVVDFKVRAIDHLLSSDFGITEGLASESVSILDPATGTGTYLLGVLRHVEKRVKEDRGGGAVAGVLRSMATRTHGFERLVGPYAVARWRLSTHLREKKVNICPQILLTDTLETPTEAGKSVPTKFNFLGKALTEERKEADRIKGAEPVMVILGNPPYGRISVPKGWEWIWSLCDTFKEHVPPEEHSNLKNLSDKYIFFIRWAFWKLLDPTAGALGRGIVAFITNRSFLEGGWASGVRHYVRSNFDRVVIIDIRGDARAPRLSDGRPDENVFQIETPTAIVLCCRTTTAPVTSCRVEYRRLAGTREEKLAELRKLQIGDAFTNVVGEGGDTFVPKGDGDFWSWPTIAHLFRAKFSGVQTKRDGLVVAVREDELRAGLKKIRDAADRSKAEELFHITPSKKLPSESRLKFDAQLVRRYGYRPLDRRILYDDPAFIDRPRATLRACWGDTNRAIVTLTNKHGSGPSAFVHACIPDLHAFRGSYGGHAFPLWDANASSDRKRTSNLRVGLLSAVAASYGDSDVEQVFEYIYGLLQAPSYARLFHNELQQSFPRLPFPENKSLFERVALIGKTLMELHCLDRPSPRGENPSKLDGEEGPIGDATYDDESQELRLSARLHLTHVTPEMWQFEVSGYPVLQRWLDARNGLTLAPDEVRELLSVTYAIRKTVELCQTLDERLRDIVAAPKLDLSALLLSEPGLVESETD